MKKKEFWKNPKKEEKVVVDKKTQVQIDKEKSDQFWEQRKKEEEEVELKKQEKTPQIDFVKAKDSKSIREKFEAKKEEPPLKSPTRKPEIQNKKPEPTPPIKNNTITSPRKEIEKPPVKELPVKSTNMNSIKDKFEKKEEPKKKKNQNQKLQILKQNLKI